MVWRISVAWITERRSSARVRASRVKPSSRDHRPMYIDGAYCAWMPPMRSSALGRGVRARSSSSWRASSARFSSRCVRVRIGGSHRVSTRAWRVGFAAATVAAALPVVY